MHELVVLFVSELENRIADFQRALAGEELDRLREGVHQLKGAAGGYGYPQISESAEEVEQTLLAEECELSDIHEQVESLIELCRRATQGCQD